MIALIPARAGSTRIPGKNSKKFCGKPLICYTIEAAIETGIFPDQIYVSSDSDHIQKIVSQYKQVKFIKRPDEYALERSPDQEWIDHAMEVIPIPVMFYVILRPTNPFRTAGTINRAITQWDLNSHMKAVEPVTQYPEKMWNFYKGKIHPLFPAEHLQQSSTFGKKYIQNGCIELRRRPGIEQYQPFFTRNYEGFDLNTPDDWLFAETLVEKGIVRL